MTAQHHDLLGMPLELAGASPEPKVVQGFADCHVSLPLWDGVKSLHLGDLSTDLSTLPTSTFDVVMASYSLHHFSSSQKRSVLGEVIRLLRATGQFIWTDLVLNPDERREDYLTRLTQLIRHDWTELTIAQRDQAVPHVLESDFPEELDWMQEQLKSFGWGRCREVLRDATFGSWVFEKETLTH